METKRQNDLPAEHKWNSMSYQQRETFLIVQGLHSNYISNHVGSQFIDLAKGLRLALKKYKIPEKQTIVTVGKKGNGRTYSNEYLKHNKVKLIPTKKDEKKKKRSHIDINVTNINKFLNGLTEAEFIYVHKTIGMAVSMRSIITDYNITKERFCEEMKIDKKQLSTYMKGSRNYDLRDIARLNALAVKLYLEHAEKNAEESTPVKVASSKK